MQHLATRQAAGCNKKELLAELPRGGAFNWARFHNGPTDLLLPCTQRRWMLMCLCVCVLVRHARCVHNCMVDR